MRDVEGTSGNRETEGVLDLDGEVEGEGEKRRRRADKPERAGRFAVDRGAGGGSGAS